MRKRTLIFIQEIILLSFCFFMNDLNAYGMSYFFKSDLLKTPQNASLQRAKQAESETKEKLSNENKINKIIESLNLYTIHSAVTPENHGILASIDQFFSPVLPLYLSPIGYVIHLKREDNEKIEKLTESLRKELSIFRENTNQLLDQHFNNKKTENSVENLIILSNMLAKFYEHLSEAFPHKKTTFYNHEKEVFTSLTHILFKHCNAKNQSSCIHACHYQSEAIKIVKYNLKQPQNTATLYEDMGNQIKHILSNPAITLPEHLKGEMTYNAATAFAEVAEARPTQRSMYYLSAADLIQDYCIEVWDSNSIDATEIEQSIAPKLTRYYVQSIKSSPNPETIDLNHIQMLENAITNQQPDEAIVNILTKHIATLFETIADMLTKQSNKCALAADYYTKSAMKLLALNPILAAQKEHIMSNFQQAGDLYAAELQTTTPHPNRLQMSIAAFEAYREAAQIAKTVYSSSNGVPMLSNLYLYKAAGDYALQAAEASVSLADKTLYAEKAWTQFRPVVKYYHTTKKDYNTAYKILEPLEPLLIGSTQFPKYKTVLDGLKNQNTDSSIFPPDDI